MIIVFVDLIVGLARYLNRSIRCSKATRSSTVSMRCFNSVLLWLLSIDRLVTTIIDVDTILECVTLIVGCLVTCEDNE